MLFSVLDDLLVDSALVEQLLTDCKIKNKAILLGFMGKKGVSFAGLQINDKARGTRSGNRFTNGFRGQPPTNILLMRSRNLPLTGAKVSRFDIAWVHGRDHNNKAIILAKKVIIIFGVGLIGSSIAELLAKSGVGKIILVDPGCLESENLSRHSLGIDYLKQNKAKALASKLSSNYPHLSIDGYANSWEDYARKELDQISSANLIISTIGDWSAESQLNSIANHAEYLPPILYGWSEPHAVSGHAVVFFKMQGCLRCLTDDLGHNRIPVTSWPKEGTIVSTPAYGGQFQPYGAVELSHIHGLICDLAIDVLLGQVKNSAHRIWIGLQKHLEQDGGLWHHEWIKTYGNPGKGGALLEVDLNADLMCPECSLHK